jgi:protoporphyrinogen/coproporphyrinogen III oxidase
MKISQGPVGKLNRDNKNVTIVGGGVAGLLMGYYLKKNGYRISLYEKDFHVGGKIRTKQTEFGPVESAANAIFTNEDVLSLLEELNLTYDCADAKLKKLVWMNNKAQTPFTFFTIIRILLGLFKKINIHNLNQQSIYDFFHPLMGKKFTSQVMSAALGGIYAETTHTIHFKSLFKSEFSCKRYYQFFLHLIRERKRKNPHRAQSVSFDGGMQTFINALKQKLNDHIYTEYSCDHIKENTIICTDADSAAALIRPLSFKAHDYLMRIKYNSMYSTTIFSNKKIPFLENAFGVVIAPQENFQTLGILNNSSIFPKRTKSQVLSSYTIMTKTKEAIDPILENEINRMAGKNFFQNHVIAHFSTQWKMAIPIYNKERYESVLALRSEMNNLNTGLVIFGNYIDGISIREMVSHAKKFAETH